MGKNLLTGMTKTRTLANFPNKYALRGILAVATACLLTSGLVSADEETPETADHVINAEKALNEHRYQDAAQEYRIAALASDDVELAKTATQVGYSYGFNEDAIRSARRWAILAPQDDEANLYIAQLYLRLGDLREAKRSFQKLLEKGEQPADEKLLRLIPILAREDPDNAYELMRQLAKAYHKSPFAHYAVAVLAIDAGKFKVAAKRAKKAIELNPEWVKPHLAYARSLLLAGDEEGAIDYTSRLVGDDPDPDPEARMELAIMLVSAGREDDALSQINQILLEQPYRADALRLMAIINFRMDRLDAAKADFENLLATGSYRMDAVYYLGRIADRRSENDQAIRYYSQVISGSNAVLSQSRAAGIMAQQGEIRKALTQLDRFAEINPNFAVDMLRAKAQVLASVERYDEALAQFDKLISYRPEDEGVHLGRAELLLRMGRIDDAIGQYEAAADRWSDSATVLNALGYTLADRTDRFDEAEKLIRKALKLQPDSAAIIDSWGWVWFRKGSYEKALGFLEDAYERLHDPEVAAHIVEVLWAMGQEDEAVSRLDEAESQFPDNDLLQGIRERLLGQTP